MGFSWEIRIMLHEVHQYYNRGVRTSQPTTKNPPKYPSHLSHIWIGIKKENKNIDYYHSLIALEYKSITTLELLTFGCFTKQERRNLLIEEIID